MRKCPDRLRACDLLADEVVANLDRDAELPVLCVSIYSRIRL